MKIVNIPQTILFVHISNALKRAVLFYRLFSFKEKNYTFSSWFKNWYMYILRWFNDLDLITI